MKKVLFFYSAANTIGLYLSLAQELRRLGLSVEFIDLSLCLDKEPNMDGHKTLEEFDFTMRTWHIKKSLKGYARYFATIEDIFDTLGPSVIFIPYEFNFFFFLVKIANTRKIKTVHIQHGLWGKGKFLPGYNNQIQIKEISLLRRLKRGIKRFKNNHRYSLKYKLLILRHEDNLERGIYFPFNSKYIIVPSDFYEKQILKEVPKFQKKNVLNCGYLRSDILFSDDRSISTEFNIPEGKKVISYFFSPFHLYPDRFSEKYNSDLELIRFIKSCLDEWSEEDLFFLVLVHPTALHYQDELKKKLVEENIQNFLITESKGLQGALYKKSFLVAGVKTGALTEASMFTDNVFRQTYVLDGEYESFQVDNGLVHSIECPSEISSQLKKYSNENRPSNNKQKILAIPDGLVANRLSKLLKTRGII